MNRIVVGAALAVAVLWSLPATAEDLVLRGMGSFHVGGRIAEVTGKEGRMIQRQPGGPMTKLDPNGQYMVEQIRSVLPAEGQEGEIPAADVARRRAHRRHL
jgi:hypothetical protein